MSNTSTNKKTADNPFDHSKVIPTVKAN